MASSASRHQSDRTDDHDQDDDDDDEYEEIEVEEEIEIEEEEEVIEEEEEIEEEIEEDEQEQEIEEVVVEEEEDDDDEEEEFEEIEVDEEVEVEEEVEEVEEEVEEEEEEEEVEVEEDDDGEDQEMEEVDDAGCDPTAAIGDNDRKDFSLDAETKGDEVHSKSVLIAVESEASSPCAIDALQAVGLGCRSSVLDERNGEGKGSTSGHSIDVKSEASVPCDVHAVEIIGLDSRSSLPYEQNRKRKGMPSIDDRNFKCPTSQKHTGDPHSCESGTVKDKQGHVDKKIAVDASDEHVPAPDGSNLGDEANQHLQTAEDMDEKASRSSASQVRPMSLSPRTECEDGNKRPAIICEYFAKGWCIKGSSCRFLHNRDHVDNSKQIQTRDKGSQDDADGSKLLLDLQQDALLVNSDTALKSSAGENSQLQHGEGSQLHPYVEKDKAALLEKQASSSLLSASLQKSPSCEDGSRPVLTSAEVEVDILKETPLIEHRNHLNSSPGYGSLSKGLGVASTSDADSKLPPYNCTREPGPMQRHYSLDRRSSPSCGSVNADFKISVPVSGRMPSYNISDRKTASSSYSSLKDDVSWTQKPFNRDKEDNVFGTASIPHSSSTLLASASQTYSHVDQSKDSPISFKYRSTFTPYNWEPSIPFRPSFFIPSLSMPSSDVQYDPIRDSMEQPDVGDSSFRHSSEGQGSRFQDAQSVFRWNSLEPHKTLHSDIWNKNYYGHEKDVPALEAESAATSASDVQNKNTISDENPVVPVSVKDILKANRSLAGGNSKLQSDAMGDLKEMKTENDRQTTDLDEDEAKTIKCFRSALIDFVKELMKPIWHEGRLSKDVYKVIVQKAEDKILSTLHPNQVPSTPESIKQYLSSSRPKILKLIQAYVDKYGKF